MNHRWDDNGQCSRQGCQCRRERTGIGWLYHVGEDKLQDRPDCPATGENPSLLVWTPAKLPPALRKQLNDQTVETAAWFILAGRSTDRLSAMELANCLMPRDRDRFVPHTIVRFQGIYVNVYIVPAPPRGPT